MINRAEYNRGELAGGWQLAGEQIVRKWNDLMLKYFFIYYC